MAVIVFNPLGKVLVLPGRNASNVPVSAGGIRGADGRAINLRKSGSKIQHQLDGDPSWTDIVDLSEITGPAGTNGTNGTDGVDGRDVEFGVSGGYINWRFVGETNWIALLSLATITGPAGTNGTNGINGSNGTDGVDGTNGVDGDDGREVELQVTGTHIQWRYVGDVSWTNLVALSVITGPAGTNGTNGTNGVDGVDGVDGEDGTSFTNVMTASGDLIYGATAGAATRLAKGTDGHYLVLVSGLPAWTALPAFVSQSTYDTDMGDIAAALAAILGS